MIWLSVAVVLSAVAVLTGNWSGGIEPVEGCETTSRAPEAAVSYRADSNLWPPGTRCIYEIGTSATLRSEEVIVPAGSWDWVLLAFGSLAVSFAVLLLFFSVSDSVMGFRSREQ